MLSDGMGGISWSGFELACVRFGIDDPEDLIDRLVTIKSHKPTEEADSKDAGDEAERDA